MTPISTTLNLPHMWLERRYENNQKYFRSRNNQTQKQLKIKGDPYDKIIPFQVVYSYIILFISFVSLNYKLSSL